MAKFRLQSRVVLRCQREQAFEFFADAESLNLLTPPWVHFSILTPPPIVMGQGTRIDYRIRIRGVPVHWRSAITEWDPPHKFTDRQVQGPYRLWVHQHIFQETPEGTLAIDEVDYRVPGGSLVNRLYVAGELRRIFEYRKSRMLEAFSSTSA